MFFNVAFDVVFDLGETESSGAEMSCGEVFGDSFMKPGWASPQDVGHAEVGQFVNEEVVHGAGNATGGIELVPADENAAIATAVVSGESFRSSGAHEAGFIRADENARTVLDGGRVEREGDGLNDHGDRLDGFGEVGEFGSIKRSGALDEVILRGVTMELAFGIERLVLPEIGGRREFFRPFLGGKAGKECEEKNRAMNRPNH